jgi:probable HAF family extracellular repeat protein
MVCIVSLFTAGLLQGAQAVEIDDEVPVTAAEATGTNGYRVLRLGTVQGGSSFGRALSRNGKAAAGSVWFDIAGNMRPAYFVPGQTPRVIYTDGPGEATGVNNLGEVVGWFTQGAQNQAFRWKTDNTLTTLPSLGGGSSFAAAINNRSEVVGWSEAAPGVRHAVVWSGNTLIDLGTWGGISAQATAINRYGDIVGYREIEIDGIRYQQGVRLLKGGKPALLRIPTGFDNLVPKGINDNGDVVGHMYPSGQELFSSVAFLRMGTLYKRLRAEPGFPTFALGVNNLKEVAGYKFEGTADPRTRGRVWRDNGTTSVPLDELPEAIRKGWYALGDADAINDTGVIVGTGQYIASGIRRIEGYMLVPKP